MHFFKGEVTASPLEELLAKWKASTQDPSKTAPSSSSSHNSADAPSTAPADAPTLDQFLGEEDILRECRSENPRLVEYVCQPHVIRELVYKAFEVPAAIAKGKTPAPFRAATPSKSPPGFSPLAASNGDDSKERQLNFAYLSSELLSADDKLIADAVLSDNSVLDTVFASVQEAEGGSLDTVVALHFSKLIVSLLKMNNTDTIETIAKRGTPLINGILTHMDSAPIADLIVRILDGPEPEQSYGVQPTNKKPADEALDMLAKANILEGLAECFVNASSDVLDPADDSSAAPTGESRAGSEKDSDELDARQRRFREETMANVTSTILGLTERILQMPDLGCAIPSQLSPYSTPSVVSQLLDAGLYASCNGDIEKNASPKSEENRGDSGEHVEVNVPGNNSALLHSLGLAADLMTTAANVVHDEENEGVVSVTGHSGGAGLRQGMGRGRAPYMGHGIGPAAPSQEDVVKASSPDKSKASPEDIRMLSEHARKKAGDLICETDSLEAELAIRFPRLAEMFGGNDMPANAARVQPLGSLRLKLVEFFVACMKSAKRETVDLMVDLGVPKKLLELFSKYQWSSMLHGVVTNSIVSALDGQDLGRPARSAWFGAGLIPWVIDSWSQNTKGEEQNPGQGRAGYMGHLIRIGTALKSYIDENSIEPNSDLPEESELKSFAVFAEQTLAPAHELESTPLCGEQTEGSDGEEGEEATEVIDIGGITLVENPDQNASQDRPLQFGYGSIKTGDFVDEEEDIKPVEVDDLDHFGDDDDEVREIKPLPDRDIPADMREQLRKSDDSAANKQVVEGASAAQEENSSQSAGSNSSERGDVVHAQSSAVESLDEFKGVIDTVDSSSDDEGSYVAFVDDQKDLDPEKVTGSFQNLRVSEPDNGASLEGTVTEIEEPGPLTPIGGDLQTLASNVVAVPDDVGDSSDEEYEAWEDPARVEDSSESNPVIGSPVEAIATSEGRSTQRA